MTSIPSHLRGMARAAGFVAWTLAVGGAWLCLRPFLSQARRLRGGARTLALWSRGLCRLLDIRVATRGGKGVSARPGPRLIVSNHIGYLDVIVLASVSPSLFVSKDDLARWPVLGPLARSVGTLFLDRDRPRAVTEVGAGMRRIFAHGQQVILFPEGTTTGGDTVGPFHTALFEPAVRAGVHVQGVRLSYASRSALDPEAMAAWTGDAAFVPHLYRLFRGRGLEVRAVFQSEPNPGADRRAVAAGVHAWMTRVDRPKESEGPRRSRGVKRKAARASLSRSGGHIFRRGRDR